MVKCCICGKEFESIGNNAMPVKEGTCCRSCNNVFVIPARMYYKDTRFTVCSNENEFNFNSSLLNSQGFKYTGTLSLMPTFYKEEPEECVALVPGYINGR